MAVVRQTRQPRAKGRSGGPRWPVREMRWVGLRQASPLSALCGVLEGRAGKPRFFGGEGLRVAPPANARDLSARRFARYVTQRPQPSPLCGPSATLPVPWFRYPSVPQRCNATAPSVPQRPQNAPHGEDSEHGAAFGRKRCANAPWHLGRCANDLWHLGVSAQNTKGPLYPLPGLGGELPPSETGAPRRLRGPAALPVPPAWRGVPWLPSFRGVP